MWCNLLRPQDYLPCPRCDNPTRVGSLLCTNCMERWPKGLVMMTQPISIDAERYYLDANLCCDKLDEQCECNDKISPYAIKGYSITEIYAQGSMCMKCWHAREGSCLPLHQWMRDVRDSRSPTQISGCTNYSPMGWDGYGDEDSIGEIPDEDSVDEIPPRPGLVDPNPGYL